MNDNSRNDIIDVIDEFDYSTQNAVYSEKFRQWRSRRDNPYAFTFEKHQRESVYVDGRGFIDKSPIEAEKKSLSAIFFALGAAALMWIVIDTVISRLIIIVLNLCGVDINMNFSSSTIYGGCYEVVAVLIAVAFLKVFIPFTYLHTKFKIPLKAEFLSNMSNPAALIGAISVTFIVCIATSIPAAYSTETKEVYQFFTSSGADVSVWNQSEFLVYSIFDVIIMPVVSQLFFCGAMFTVMRQFGDYFAVVMMSATATLLTQDLHIMPAVFLVSLVGAYGMLTSGTIFTAVVVNILYKMYDLSLTIIENDHSENMMMYRLIFMCSVLAAGSLGLVLYRNMIKRKKIHLAGYNSELTFGRRVLHASKTFPYSVVAILCIICAVIRTVL
ncbi:MAG: CPBP family intramembrane metalloprotease [Ruminococcus sp.]|nr:CPBP family intramembrane metalloprotease [Ruminococcus sp.]